MNVYTLVADKDDVYLSEIDDVVYTLSKTDYGTMTLPPITWDISINSVLTVSILHEDVTFSDRLIRKIAYGIVLTCHHRPAEITICDHIGQSIVVNRA